MMVLSRSAVGGRGPNGTIEGRWSVVTLWSHITNRRAKKKFCGYSLFIRKKEKNSSTFPCMIVRVFTVAVLFLSFLLPSIGLRLIKLHNKFRMISANFASSSPRGTPLSASNDAITADISSTSRKNMPGSSTIKDSSVNLMKNCVGAGVFSLSSRVNAVSSNPATLLPASALVMLMAIWATYNFHIIGDTCEATNSFSYPEAWGNTVSMDSQWLVTSAIVISPIVSCLANTIVLTDILGLILRTVGVPLFIYGNRNLVIALLTGFVLFPLCSLEDLSALKSVSAFGIMGQLLAMTTLAIRLADKSYFPGGEFFTKPIAAVAGATVGIDHSKWFVLASLLSYCFVSHYNAPRYYSELCDRSSKNFLTMASISYSLTSIIYIVTMTLGLKLFGVRTQSFVLNNFSVHDPLGTVARLAFGSSVLASFPLIFLTMRNWFIALASKRAPRIARKNIVTMALLCFISTLAVFFKDIGVVGSLAGGILGSSVMFIFPPIMYIRSLQKTAARDGKPQPLGTIALNVLLMTMGGLLAIFGTYNNLSAAFKK